ncbi:MAG: CoA-transferase [Dehalococcoidales bacterium]
MSINPTHYEVIASVISHELNDDEVWFIGLATGLETIFLLSRIPLVGMSLAQHMHAPNSIMTVQGFIVNPVVSETPTAMESEFATELYDWRCECQNSKSLPTPDVGFGSSAQIDKYGNSNIVAIGDYHKPKVRLIGPINQPAHFSMFGREYVVFDHDKRNFVDKVDFVSGVGYVDGPGGREKLGLPGGGPRLILTDKAIFDFHSETKLAKLKSIHAGVSLDEVIENTGYTHDWVPDQVPVTPQPTDEEVRLIREVIDPEAKLLPR